jgi:hypothetical protein
MARAGRTRRTDRAGQIASPAVRRVRVRVDACQTALNERCAAEIDGGARTNARLTRGARAPAGAAVRRVGPEERRGVPAGLPR